MKKFLTNPVGLGFAAVGVVLMALTIAWRVNPVEGSVIAKFLTGNMAGQVLLWILLVTCMPVWIAAAGLSSLIRVPDHVHYPLTCAVMLVLQAAVYLLLGTLSSVAIRKLRGNREPSN